MSLSKTEKAARLQLLLDCAENGIQIKDVKGFEGRYSVLSNGWVYSHKKYKFMKQHDNGHGYLFVRMTDDFGAVYTKRVNVLVAEAFCEKPAEWQLDWDAAHLDDNPYNNDASNLQWQSRAENCNTERWREAAKRSKTRTKVRCVETGEVYDSMSAAGRAIGLSYYGINLCVLGKQKTCGGYHWERVETDTEAAVS